ncbi:MAG: flavodoxin family protein [Promethearchaeota archaeon]
MKILGIIGSARKFGNGEILVKEALFAAREKGATVRAIRLTDYRLLSCKGCLACVLKGDPCRLDDDMHTLWDQLQWADGIIISAPTYFLGPSGIIKMLMDRLFEFSLQLGQIRRRPAALIVTAGLREWDPLTMPMLTMLAGILQLDIIEKFTAYRPGPGEVLLDEPVISNASRIGQRIVDSLISPISKEVSTDTQNRNVCIQCGTPFIQLLEANVVECPLCQAQGYLRPDKENTTIEWGKTSGQNRWSPQALAKHFAEWVIKTGPVFKKHQARIQELRQRYKTLEIENPPRT